MSFFERKKAAHPSDQTPVVKVGVSPYRGSISQGWALVQHQYCCTGSTTGSKTVLAEGDARAALVGSSVLASDGASTYCTGWSYQGLALLLDRRCELDWVEFTSPQNGNTFLVIQFLINQIKIQFNPIEKN